MAKRLHAFRLIVGMGYDRDGSPITESDRESHRIETELYCATEFGGGTFSDGRGVWVDPKGNPITEPVLDITILRTIDPDDGMESAYRIAIAQDIGRIWSQHSVVIIGPDGRSSIIEC